MIESVRQIVAENLIMERGRRRYSQELLAGLSGVSRQTISEIERQTTAARIDILDQLAGALGISMQRLFVDPDKRRGGDPVEQIRSAMAEGLDTDELLERIEEIAGRTRLKHSSAGRPRAKKPSSGLDGF